MPSPRRRGGRCSRRLDAIGADALVREGADAAPRAARTRRARSPARARRIARTHGRAGSTATATRWVAANQATADDSSSRAVNELPEREPVGTRTPPEKPVGTGAQLRRRCRWRGRAATDRGVLESVARERRPLVVLHAASSARERASIAAARQRSASAVTDAPARLGRILAGARADAREGAPRDDGSPVGRRRDRTSRSSGPARNARRCAPGGWPSAVVERFVRRDASRCHRALCRSDEHGRRDRREPRARRQPARRRDGAADRRLAAAVVRGGGRPPLPGDLLAGRATRAPARCCSRARRGSRAWATASTGWSAAGAMGEAIVVAPDCFTRWGGAQYLDSPAIGDYETHVVREVIPAIDARFRTRRGARRARDRRQVVGRLRRAGAGDAPPRPVLGGRQPRGRHVLRAVGAARPAGRGAHAAPARRRRRLPAPLRGDARRRTAADFTTMMVLAQAGAYSPEPGRASTASRCRSTSTPARSTGRSGGAGRPGTRSRWSRRTPRRCAG